MPIEDHGLPANCGPYFHLSADRGGKPIRPVLGVICSHHWLYKPGIVLRALLNMLNNPCSILNIVEQSLHRIEYRCAVLCSTE